MVQLLRKGNIMDINAWNSWFLALGIICIILVLVLGASAEDVGRNSDESVRYIWAFLAGAFILDVIILIILGIIRFAITVPKPA